MTAANGMPDLSTWLSDAEVCARLEISARTLDREAKAGRMHPMNRHRPGLRAQRVWNPEDIDARLPQRPAQVMPPETPPVRFRPYLSDVQIPPVTELSRSGDLGGALVTALAGALQRIADVVETRTLPPQRPATPWLTLPDASEYTGLSVAYLRRVIKAGKLPWIRDRAIKVRRADLDNLDSLAELTQ